MKLPGTVAILIVALAIEGCTSVPRNQEHQERPSGVQALSSNEDVFHFRNFSVSRGEIPSSEMLQIIEFELWALDRLTSDDCKSINELLEAVEDADVLSSREDSMRRWNAVRPRLEYLLSLDEHS